LEAKLRESLHGGCSLVVKAFRREQKDRGFKSPQPPKGGKMDIVELIQKLISIPSFVDQKTDERKIGEYLYGYLKQFKWLKVEKQPVISGRFNVIAKDKYPTRLLICGHMDTIQPSTGWQTNPVSSTVKNGKIYGLGATDMKSGLGVILSTLNGLKQTKGLMMLFYIDEEYDFGGMKQFTRRYKKRVKPILAVSLDGSELELQNACRGLIEITLQVQGKTGHAAKPSSGNNAIDGLTEAISKLKFWLSKNGQIKTLVSACNLAYIRGGQNQGIKNNSVVVGKQGNIIPDYCEGVIDIRPARNKIDASLLIKLIKDFIKSSGCNLTDYKIRHNLKGWITEKTSLKQIEEIIKKSGIKIRYKNPNDSGYIDVQMINEAFNCPCCVFGAGEEKMAHKANEFVKINRLKKAEKMLREIIIQLAR
jgi:succinyl-diaminopimelate desuccinylase